MSEHPNFSMAGLVPATQHTSVRERMSFSLGTCESFAAPARGRWVAGSGPAMVMRGLHD